MNYSNGKGKIISNREIAPDHYKMEVESPATFGEALPGQFVMVKVSDGVVPILRRPFGIFQTDKDKGSFEILYRKVGEGTRLLADIAPGVDLDILGPLGTGFDLDLSGDNPLLIAGGVGIAPLYMLAKELVSAGKQVKVLFGSRGENDLLVIDELKALGVELLIATEDGSEGFKGYGTDLLEELLERGEEISAVYACGPELMLEKVDKIALSYDLTCQLSLEAIMACGFGVCLGCVVKICSKDKEREFDYNRVCCEGPVFNAGEVIWDEA
jgi:dihydroorotate dehydrogenase electron transfer subunit